MTFANGQGATPPAQDEDPLDAAIRSLLPERSAEDRAHGEVRISVGVGEQTQTVLIPVLFAAPNRVWTEKFRNTGQQLFANLESDTDGKAVMSLLLGATDTQLDLLAAYNPQLLGREYLETHATEEQILDAFLGVTAAAFPFPVKLVRVFLSNRDVSRWVRLQLVRLLYSSNTSSSLPSTDGAPRKSKKP